MSFENFTAAYVDHSGTPGSVWLAPHLVVTPGYTEFAHAYAGTSFRGGLYRFHDATSGPLGQRLAEALFGEFRGRFTVFAHSWSGRQFAIDLARVVDDEPQLLLLDPADGRGYEIPRTFTEFHDDEIVHNAHAPLLSQWHAEWLATGFGARPLAPDECVGHRIPLYLGGEDALTNLEITDFEQHWTFCAQLRAQFNSRTRSASA